MRMRTSLAGQAGAPKLLRLEVQRHMSRCALSIMKNLKGEAMSKRQATIDTLMLQLDIQSRAIRMTRADREKAKQMMREINKKL